MSSADAFVEAVGRTRITLEVEQPGNRIRFDKSGSPASVMYVLTMGMADLAKDEGMTKEVYMKLCEHGWDHYTECATVGEDRADVN